MHEEITNKANCEMITQLIYTTQHENVRAKMLELIQTWAYAFRSAYKYRAIKVRKSHYSYLFFLLNDYSR